MADPTSPEIQFLLQGDPVIRWQTMRDLLKATQKEWQTEREKIATEGWGLQFLQAQQSDGNWPTGRWTGTTWTLLTLVDCGFPPTHPAMRKPVDSLMARHLPAGSPIDPKWLLANMDLCHLGFWVRCGSYFTPDDPRIAALAEIVLSQQLADGGWNCRRRTVPQTIHSSFHTTFNVLEGLREAKTARLLDPTTFRKAESKALEFMLAHRMFKSDKTGEIISERFLHLTYPSYWHYTVLRGLDYIRQTPEINDPRLNDALEYLHTRRKPNGRWHVEKRIPGTTLFEMEKQGGDSRWNTLRVLRTLKRRG